MSSYPKLIDVFRTKGAGAEETGVKGFAERPLRSRLPTLRAARCPHGGHRGDRLEGDAGLELAVLPWKVFF